MCLHEGYYLFATLKHIICLWETPSHSLICLCQLTHPLATTPGSGAIAQTPPSRAQAVTSQEELMMSMIANLASVTSRTSMSMVIVGGVVGNTLMNNTVENSAFLSYSIVRGIKYSSVGCYRKLTTQLWITFLF